jgi:hypothetical protein
MPNLSRRVACIAWAMVAVAAVLLPVSCGLDKEPTPDPVGPSEQGVSVEFVAAPDTLNADGGRSYSVIRLVLRDAKGKPISNRSVLFTHDGDGQLLPAPSSIYVGPVQDESSKVMATDSNGTAFMHYLSGTAIDIRVHIWVRPYGTDTAFTSFYRQVEIVQK